VSRPPHTTADAGTTRPALATAAFGLTLTLTAALLDAEPLYVPGLTFMLIAGAAMAWVLIGSHGITVGRTVGAHRVVEDEPLAVLIEVRAGATALPTGAIHDPLLPRPAPLAVGRRGTRVRIAARFARRGRRTLAVPRVVIRDPFGLATRLISTTGEHEILVLPRVEPVLVLARSGGDMGLGLTRTRRAALAEVELDGIAPLRPGTPASRIFWPSIARLAEPQERRLHADGDRLPLVVLDPRTAPGAAGALDLDAAVRATASLAVHLAKAGGCHVLLPGDRRPTALDVTLAAWPRLHVRLALVGGGELPPTRAIHSRLGPVIYVAAQRLRRPPRALRHAPGGGRVLVVPVPLPGKRAAFTVAGCTGHELTDAASLLPGAA